jgi:hypothetical protein
VVVKVNWPWSLGNGLFELIKRLSHFHNQYKGLSLYLCMLSLVSDLNEELTANMYEKGDKKKHRICLQLEEEKKNCICFLQIDHFKD